MLLTTNALAMTRKVADSEQFVMCVHTCSCLRNSPHHQKHNPTASAFFTQNIRDVSARVLMLPRRHSP